MQFDRYTEDWFEYIYKNPEKNISLDKIIKETKNINKTKKNNFHKFLNQIKFKTKLREIFFNCNKNTIIFHNPITSEDIEREGIDANKLEREIKKLN